MRRTLVNVSLSELSECSEEEDELDVPEEVPVEDESDEEEAGELLLLLLLLLVDSVSLSLAVDQPEDLPSSESW